MPFYGKIRFSFLDSKLPRAPSPLWFRGPLGQLTRPGGVDLSSRLLYRILAGKATAPFDKRVNSL